MKTIYVADDGTQFDDEWECLDYEWKQQHTALSDVVMYDRDCKRLTNLFSEKTYGDVYIIDVITEEAAKALNDLGEYTGFCCYDDIKHAGTWKFNEDESTFTEV